MATQYTSILKLALPVTGELSGTWGNVVNDNITQMVEQAIAGLATINTWTANAHTLTVADGTTSESRCAMLVADDDGSGNPSAAAEIICPDRTKLYILKNISGQQVTLKTSSGTGVAVPNNETAFLFCDGTNVNSCITSIINGRVSGNLIVDGNTTLGDSASDTVTFNADIASTMLPSADNTYDLGSSGASWKDLYIDGTAYLALVDINGGAIDGVTLGTNSPVTEAQIDNININGNTISSTNTNGNLVLAPQGSGDVQVDADTLRVGDSGANATITSNGAGDLILNTNAGTNSGSITIEDGSNGNIAITPNGTGEVDISKVDIAGGEIDGTTIGSNSAAAGRFTGITITGATATRVPFATTNGLITDSANLTFDGTTLTAGGFSTTGTYNKVTITAPATSATLTIANGKTLTANSSLTLAGTDATTMTFPSTSATIARTDASQTFTGDQTFSNNVSAAKLIPTGNVTAGNGMYLPAANTVAIGTNGTAAITVDSSQNVGIGTGTPAGKVHASNSYSNSSDLSFVADANIPGYNLRSSAGGRLSLVTGFIGANISSLLSATGTSNPSDELMRFSHSSKDVSFLAGNVGIGTGSPSRQLTVYGSAPYIALQNSTTGAANTDGLQLQMINNDGYLWNFENSFLAFGTNDAERARITSGGGFQTPNTSTELHQFGVNRTGVVFNIINANTSSPSGLNIQFSGATPNNTTNYFLECYDPTNSKCNIFSSGTITNRTGTYNSYSDAKLKQDITDASSQWDDIKALRVVKYRLKDEVAADPNYPAYIGLIAQEVEQISPGLVDDCPDYENVTKTREVEKTREVTPAVLDEDGNEIEPAVTETYTEEEEYTEREPTGTVTKAVKYSILYMKAVKALQEAMERIEILEAKVAALEQE